MPVIRARYVAVPVALLAAAGACNSVLGIDSASLVADAGGGGGGGLDAGTPFAALDNCSAYCGDMKLSCPQGSAGQEYIASAPDADVCGALCGDMIGFYDEPLVNSQVNLSATMPTDNTIACRIWHAHVALGIAADSGDHLAHCSHAGPLGGEMCGADPCAVFCHLATAVCNKPDAMAYSSEADCLDACRPNADAGYPGYVYVTDQTVSDLDTREPAGNNLNCRMYHLENYLATGQDIHCTHASRTGNGICVDNDP
jgi:hypothetical protein